MKHNWEYKVWNDVLRIINGKNQKAVENPNGIYPIYGSGGIMSYANEYICPENTTIIGRKGSINNPIYVTTKFWNVDTAFGIVSYKDLLSPRYLYYFCVNYDFMKHNKATTLPSLVKSDLLKITMPVPPMEVQERIVAELDKINELIEVKREQLKQLDALAQSLFYDTFGDPVTNPKGWNCVIVKDIANVKIGPFGSLLHKEDYISGGIPLVNPIHMSAKKIRADKDYTISEDKLSELKAYMLRTNDVIFGRRGDIGRCALVTSGENGYLCGTGSLFVRFKTSINPIFSVWTLSQPSIVKWLIEKAKGATMLNINCNIVENIPIMCPPLDLQQKFAAQVEAIDAQKAMIEKSIAELQTLLDSRMDYWFN